MRHNLKTHPGPFEATWDGRKKHEFRLNDREFAVNDTLDLWEYLPNLEITTGRQIVALVTYVGIGFGIPDGYVCMSVEVLEKRA